MIRQQLIKRRRRLDAQVMRTVANGRSCGECDACCYVLGVVELEKPEHTECQYSSGVTRGTLHGCCTIYDEKPKTCGVFKCLWRQGHLADDQRPDKVGIFAYIDDGTSVHRGDMIVCECEPHAAESVFGRMLIATLSMTHRVRVTRSKPRPFSSS